MHVIGSETHHLHPNSANWKKLASLCFGFQLRKQIREILLKPGELLRLQERTEVKEEGEKEGKRRMSPVSKQTSATCDVPRDEACCSSCEPSSAVFPRSPTTKRCRCGSWQWRAQCAVWLDPAGLESRERWLEICRWMHCFQDRRDLAIWLIFSSFFYSECRGCTSVTLALSGISFFIWETV